MKKYFLNDKECSLGEFLNVRENLGLFQKRLDVVDGSLCHEHENGTYSICEIDGCTYETIILS